MAKLSSDGTYVTVEKGDTLSEIALVYGKGKSYKQLAAINGISNPDLIYVKQKIKLNASASSSNNANTSNQAIIKQFGYQSNSNGTLFATWSWDKDKTENYKCEWTYHTGDGVWFIGSDSTSEHKQSTYNIPSNATKVRFRVKPISKTYTVNNKETSYWTANWSSYETYVVDEAPVDPPKAPDVNIVKYTLTAELSNITINANKIQFQVVKDNSTVFKTGTATIKTDYASYSCTVTAGSKYKVRCRAIRDNDYSDWSEYSSNQDTIPAVPGGITAIRATSDTAVYLEWSKVNSATSYDIEYTTKKHYFDGSNSTTTVSGALYTHYEITGLGTGEEYFFRVRAKNEKGESAWSGIKSVKLGKKPDAPTTWSSTTTAVVGDEVKLYWVHNAEDGSSQTYAKLILNIDGEDEPSITIKNSTDEEEKDKTSVYTIDTNDYPEGTTIKWKVCTAGITLEYGDWSVERTVNVYAPPTLELSLIKKTSEEDSEQIDTITTFPVYVKALAGPANQFPIGYHLSITADETYESIDPIGNTKTVSKGDEVYSKFYDIQTDLMVELSANNIDLENNVNYTITCVLSMNTGLTVTETLPFTVSWVDKTYEPNAEINIDPDTLVAYIRPYCEGYEFKFYSVTKIGTIYTATTTPVAAVWGEPLDDTFTTDGRQVYSGILEDGTEIYYYEEITGNLIDGFTLSVYRREFDGRFVELATGLENTKQTFITDPHPSLDFARYRIVATDSATGTVSYCDIRSYPVGEKAVVIQWDEKWTNFDVSSADELAEPPWSGSLLKLPYNIDVSDSRNPDVSLVEYIGRSHPVSYYGTQTGETASWNMEIDKQDKETLYALRRLAIWMGDVYVREPSGSGYWANITVSFSQKHCAVIIPVTISITRVEGGM